MAQVLLLSDTPDDALPPLGLLTHRIRTFPAEASSIVRAPNVDVTLIDARTKLAHARSLCQLVKSSMLSPVLVIVTEAGLATLNESWQADDFILDEAGPGEIDARIRLAAVETAEETPVGEIRAGGITIDETTYMATINGRLLNLTYKEFELLKHLALHPGQVFTRDRLLHDVWGYDYFGGTRTVDVHIRRLRAKLGPDHESLIGTVRNVGYRLVIGGSDTAGPADDDRRVAGADAA
ncbi:MULTISPECIES: response regulator transcription factor [unclassified Nesterenkonia]|uniref:response regulator transcription factor n=1 Tax=unclassified Nesterenkonia TaxID=2629769 RepID=UPI001F4CA45C|nr:MULTISPECIES: response regulator transcription factor [unclassified Nesterenkonia]MCH8560560.1 response regulator transcription factor [Nesterenkonia sp. DZ6]MCH8562827.1 response regulator transcription factor [Nesterenkonia sp. YGD6]MCH8570668.1 response regulator transcription factor [Nesterenkonia sp. AY15]